MIRHRPNCPGLAIARIPLCFTTFDRESDCPFAFGGTLIVRATGEKMNTGSFSVWCQHRRVSKWRLYDMWKSGDGPRFHLVGTRRLISSEADADWIRRQERLTETAEVRAALEKASERGRTIVKRAGAA